MPNPGPVLPDRPPEIPEGASQLDGECFPELGYCWAIVEFCEGEGEQRTCTLYLYQWQWNFESGGWGEPGADEIDYPPIPFDIRLEVVDPADWGYEYDPITDTIGYWVVVCDPPPGGNCWIYEYVYVYYDDEFESGYYDWNEHDAYPAYWDANTERWEPMPFPFGDGYDTDDYVDSGEFTYPDGTVGYAVTVSDGEGYYSTYEYYWDTITQSWTYLYHYQSTQDGARIPGNYLASAYVTSGMFAPGVYYVVVSDNTSPSGYLTWVYVQAADGKYNYEDDYISDEFGEEWIP